MKKRIFRGASYIILALSLPAIGWGLKEDVEFTTEPVTIQEQVIKPTNTAEEIPTAAEVFEKHLTDLYDEVDLDDSSLSYDVFKKAVTGFYNFQNTGLTASDKQILSIVDFSKPSTEKRLWVIDLDKKKVLFHSLVAHGRGSGDNWATNFSNTPNSHQSSLGFYITSHTYIGKHGLSLKLDGMDAGYNTNALNRAIVVHGADYVSDSFVRTHGRLGRSHGCPALPNELNEAIINTIKGKTALFINGPKNKTFSSNYLDEKIAAELLFSKAVMKQASL
ncbi:murein L,D-transpeptidase catalytic domain family protein [Pedobacter sp. SYSU D00535]|uniref:murein L,D-transpeptidase catalytic domain family protein n=1 Tax=Pedobacter sp. SYSU D00535 TaxID=2810308 RepID=UPI001A9736C5|nr:murein L,D-transpeptidase catalytic domain family protein [Pedobacter sp. SYSU D00535]